MPEIVPNKLVELTDAELEAVSGGQNGGNGGNANGGFNNFFAGANFTNAGSGGNANGGNAQGA